jgi:hypothetical protein
VRGELGDLILELIHREFRGRGVLYLGNSHVGRLANTSDDICLMLLFVKQSPSDLRKRLVHVLWLGGMSGVGKTTGARKVARRYDLRLYSLDAHNYAHAERTDPERHPALASFSTLSPDELWVQPEPESIAERFVASSRERLELVIEDLLGLPDDAPVIADGPQLLPAFVAPLVQSVEQALFILAQPHTQEQLVRERGTSVRVSHPDRALENRLRRDELLSERVQREANEHGFTVIEVTHAADTEAAIEEHFAPLLAAWLAGGDRGDVSARRREENDARLRQWRWYSTEIPKATDGELALACECSTPACAETVSITLPAAETARERGEAFLAHR